MPSSRYYRFKTISKEEKDQKREIIIFWFFFAAGFLTIMWAFFLSPFFKITEIGLPKNDVLASGDVFDMISNQKPLNLGGNLFILSKTTLKDEISKLFPAITKIEIKKEPFHILKINFIKRMPVGIWCSANCYYFDEDGIIFKEAPISEGSLILKITDNNKTGVSLGDQVLSSGQLKFITEFNKKIGDNNRFKIIEFKIKTAPDLEAVTSGGWSIYLDQGQNPLVAANNLIIILDEAVKNKTSNLEYIDLRIPTRVFYKLK